MLHSVVSGTILYAYTRNYVFPTDFFLALFWLCESVVVVVDCVLFFWISCCVFSVLYVVLISAEIQMPRNEWNRNTLTVFCR